MIQFSLEKKAKQRLSFCFLPHLAASSSSHGYPSSSKKKVNWDALAAEAVKEDEKKRNPEDPNSGGGREVNELFQKLYAGATDDQVRVLAEACRSESTDNIYRCFLSISVVL